MARRPSVRMDATTRRQAEATFQRISERNQARSLRIAASRASDALWSQQQARARQAQNSATARSFTGGRGASLAASARRAAKSARAGGRGG